MLLRPGLYQYRQVTPGERARIHLRVDGDGSGTLIVNASRVYQLNAVASLMAHLLLEGRSARQVETEIRRAYSVGTNRARSDVADFRARLSELVRPDGACPIHDLVLDILPPFSARPTAPYRMDLAITYRCNNDCSHCYNARERNHAELPTETWFAILDRLWELRIPHVVFTGGEPTLRDDLPALIAHAEANGQITGLNTNGRRLSSDAYTRSLVDAGLDHVQITVESAEEEVHDGMVRARGAHRQTLRGLQNALGTSLFVMTNTTLLQNNRDSMEATLDRLAALGVRTIGLNALIHAGRGAQVGTGLDEKDLGPLLSVAAGKTDEYGQRLIWYTPTEYCRFDPSISDLGVKGCTAALYSMCVEPDGQVLPCQSYYSPLGNILDREWDEIWNHELAVRLRERQVLPAKCTACPIIQECGGGCPLRFPIPETATCEENQ